MNTWLWMWAGLASAGSIAAAETVTVPWSEFSDLYRQRIEEDFRNQMPIAPPEDLYVIHELTLEMQVGETYLDGTLTCEGKVIEGAPRVPLVGPSVLVEGVHTLEGGELLLVDGMTSLIPTASPSFKVTLEILVPVADSQGILTAKMELPQAVQRTVRLHLPEHLRLIEQPGLKDDNEIFHLSSCDDLLLKLTRKPDATAHRSVEVDILTRIELQGKRLLCTAFYLPVQALHEPVEVRLPPLARWKTTSLPTAQVVTVDEATYRITQRPGSVAPFHIQYTLETSPDDSRFLCELSDLAGNEGGDHFLVIDQPESGLIEALPEDGASTLDPVATPTAFLDAVARKASCFLVSEGTGVPLQISRFSAVDTPPAVLESVHFFTAFEENGGRLSQFVLEVPATVGPRMFIERIPDADIWSLQVNGTPRQVRTGTNGDWVIALDPGGPSTVELAYLTRAEPLGLQGKIDARMPGVGLPAKRVSVGIGLPERVELLSIDGPVTPATRPSSGPPDAFSGTPYYFSRSYYEGNGLALSAYYKEPAGTNRVSP